MAAATLEPSATGGRRRRFDAASDEQLARAAGRGDTAAFETLYERHHLRLLSFARHMVGRVHDAEDVVQHTFIAADRVFRSGRVPGAVRAWLYTVARNRCISVLRARREEHELPDAGLPSTENLAADVEHREELRELLSDLHTLPDDQRAALLLAELGDLSHVEVAKVIGVRAGKVKALVFQARQNLLAAADARSIPCRAIREELSVATGSSLRRRHLRNHVAHCEECSSFAQRVRAQRASLAAILPVVPTIALRDGVLGALGGAGGAAAAGAGGAGAGLGLLAVKSTAAKVLTIAAVGGTAVGGGTVAVNTLDHDAKSRPATGAARDRPRAPVPVPAVAVGVAGGQGAGLSDAGGRPATGPRPDRGRGTEERLGDSRRADRPGGKPGEPPGSRGHGKPEDHASVRAPKSESNAKGKPDVTPKPRAAPEPKAKARPEVQPKPRAAPKPKAKAKPEVQAKRKAEPKPKAKAKPEVQAKRKAEPKPKAKARPEVQPKPKPESKPEVKARPEVQPKPKPETKPEPEPKAEREPKAPAVTVPAPPHAPAAPKGAGGDTAAGTAGPTRTPRAADRPAAGPAAML